MHNLFLGELRHHCMSIWGIDVKDVKDKSSSRTKVKPHSPEEQTASLELLAMQLMNGSTRSVLKIRKGYIIAVAQYNKIAPEDGLFSKQAYVHALGKWVRLHPGLLKLPPALDEPTTDFHLKANEYDISKFHVLEPEVIQTLQEDIMRTHFPSWMERPPRNFGSASHGKLKADQWRTACTVSMVITLCRLWGSASAPPRERVLLENFIHLVCAVDLASRRSMNKDRADKFDEHLFRYLTTLRSLFDNQLVPNHHLSMHLKECLYLFGPVHAWWAFPFERFNGLLQHLNINNKSNQIPLTFIRYFYIGSGIRWLMASTKWPDHPVYRKMVVAYHKGFQDAARGTRFATYASPGSEDNEDGHPDYQAVYDEKKETGLSSEIYGALLARLNLGQEPALFTSLYAKQDDGRPRLHLFANNVPNVVRDALTFASAKAATRNSFILFKDLSSAGSVPRAGQIRQIFLHGRMENGRKIVEPFIVVDEYRSLSSSHGALDPYRVFPDLNTRLYYNKHIDQPRVLKVSDIVSHFAAFIYTPDTIGTECIVARSLER
ncbi:uncharacterized protein TRAVEDRAFT_93475, partial [Trametes versicolor FP-101664 SS1]